MKVGSPEHRDLFCQSFIDGHQVYEPENLAWPQVEQKYLERLRAIPFWGIAKAMERKAGIMVTAFAATLDDPLIRQAIAVQGIEETRHARLMAHFIERYELPAREIDVGDAGAGKAEFVVFGYEECVDFLMGVGLFELSIERDMFPKNLVSIFEQVLFEEARHVTFFINWFRYEEARAGRDGAFSRYLIAAKNYYGSIKQLIRSFSGTETTGFAAVGANAMIEGITPMMFLEAALAGNRRLLGHLDARLVKPSLLPVLCGSVLTLLRALPPRAETPALAVIPAALPAARDSSVAA